MGTFKDVMGRWVTVGLFKETAGPNKSFVIMSLDEARKAFVDLRDVTGYLFAEKYLGGYPHWKEIEASPKLHPHIEEWREEIEIALKAESLIRVQREAEEGHFQANKLLIEKGWEPKKAGRPSKADIQEEARKQAAVAGQVKEFLRPLK